MIDQSKLQNIFEAALRDPTPVSQFAPPKQAFPATAPGAPVQTLPVQSAMPNQAPAVESPFVTTQPKAAEAPSNAPVLDDAASDELAKLLDEQQKRRKRKQRIASLTTAAMLVGSVGGGSLWFIQSPDRVTTLMEAIRDIRSVGDVKSLVAKFQDSLDRVAVRSKQIDAATSAMGVTPSAADEKDPYFDKEMREMMGGEGRTVGQRNRQLIETFSKRAEEAGGLVKTEVALEEHESFDWTD